MSLRYPLWKQHPLNDQKGINRGTTVVASELIAHGHNLFYYDSQLKNEVNYLIDYFGSLSVAPIAVKSRKTERLSISQSTTSCA